MNPAGAVDNESYLVTSSASTLIAGAQAGRDGIVIYNQDSPVYLGLSQNCSDTMFSIRLPKRAVWEMEGYTGPVSCIAVSSPSVVKVASIY